MGFLQDKTAVIACAGSIGFGIAAAYAKEGCNLVITARDMKELAIAKERLESEHGVKVLIAADAGLEAFEGQIARAAVRLVSPELKHLSGEILTLEGGMDLRL